MQHTPYSLKQICEENSITPGSCKTFNLAGFPAAAAIVPNKEIRDDFLRNTKGIVSHIDSVAYVAAEAAYSFGQNGFRVKRISQSK